MYIYAGIDEAGYGPMFGPLLVGRMVLGIPALHADMGEEVIGAWIGRPLWDRLGKGVCRDLVGRKGRIAVNDSKKLHGGKKISQRASKPAGQRGEEAAERVSSLPLDGSMAQCLDGSPRLPALEHLERGALAFAALGGRSAASVCEWLDALGENCHHDLAALPWYAPTSDHPWDALPRGCTAGEVAVARSLLASVAKEAGVEVLDLGAAVVFEDRFNRMVAATRSKASMSFTFVAGHLRTMWDKFGVYRPNVVVDRQSGRTHYRELLALTFPEADLSILDETPERSAYHLRERAPAGKRAMTISFEVESESNHMPVALASMISKYTRELLMARFQAWFLARAPHVRPTAGYALDAKRFWEEIQPILPQLAIEPGRLMRCS